MSYPAEHNLLAQACFKVSIQDRAEAADLLDIIDTINTGPNEA